MVLQVRALLAGFMGLSLMSQAQAQVVIVAPNVATDEMKATAAIAGYYDVSAKRDKALDNALKSAPRTYQGHLNKLLDHQGKTLEALDKALDFQAKSSAKAISSAKSAEGVYGEAGSKTVANTETGRMGADFKAEAADLKLSMKV
jgi:hypothetical protein|mmetsp:Transcript_35883/g.78268  ORF Transcript_35883/g.78268 Transcript_35883/m.78268 type:complete len:145 (+) Transcript_35883:108-542(+)